MMYQDYLKSNEWKNLRMQALTKRGFTCEFCGEDARIVHHVRYPKDFSDDSLKNLVVVCKRCHDLCHGIRDYDRIKLERQRLVIARRQEIELERLRKIKEDKNDTRQS